MKVGIFWTGIESGIVIDKLWPKNEKRLSASLNLGKYFDFDSPGLVKNSGG